ncbi:hypothetical protein B0A58_09800 [Flavobacterium branchiophilum NBRC 15030 = ATCC 35035]|uniref:Outer membrane protein with beta-barrel domain n=1 Tax=Flavobacterium branchiophilum TaxID=55197 RepID=A0A543G622_9FLAO|nr:outer membrane beta-barrel protein [Flavobacterium branchiophilum]OXA74883.1 hypothetical protein B0A58_09800 [Flavobacterium branchiophilum NBRC 15030 = ATCC 35035]TQM41505.1 outer membrane protein with beta-barrel domain [Flavobacterium branchiophilum]GEM54208.1 hypothetical protein FB1_04290 [Flavobacterium branchiophilum NBRC 15030 = ATCC 35035]
MKKLYIVLILSIAFIGNAQELQDWQVGITANTFVFSRINPDYNPQKAKQNLINGHGFGISIEKNWNPSWGIKTGLIYNNQNQKYDNFFHNGNVYTSTVNMDFSYYKLPVTIQYTHQIKENLYLIINQGVQMSLLNDYKTIIDSELGIETLTPNFINGIAKQSFITPVEYYYKIENYGWIYKNRTYGIVGSVGIKGILAKKLTYSTSIKYEYDITSADTDKAYFSENFNTKNFCIGLEFGMQYHFSLTGCSYCKNQPH